MTESRQKTNHPARRVLIFGLGDLGSRISQAIAERALATDVKLVSRGHAASQWARMLTLGTSCRVTSEKLDARELEAVTRVLAAFQPDLVIQCASLLSPWALLETGSPAALRILQAGFALQISAQLPIILTVMRACKSLTMSCPIINCSFPDLTHPILSRMGFAPTSGVGNVAMVARYIEDVRRDLNPGRLRVIAHHAQVAPFLTGKLPTKNLVLPIVEQNGELLGEAALTFASELTSGRHFNYLTAATAVPLITALLDDTVSLHTHAPGILGLPGGYPISIRNKKIDLDLPPAISQEQAIAFNNTCARADGVERIESDGNLVYTGVAIKTAKPICAELAAPLSPANLDSRLAVLLSFYNDCQRSSSTSHS